MFYIEDGRTGNKRISLVFAFEDAQSSYGGHSRTAFMLGDHFFDGHGLYYKTIKPIAYEDVKIILLHHQKNNLIADFSDSNIPNLEKWVKEYKEQKTQTFKLQERLPRL